MTDLELLVVSWLVVNVLFTVVLAMILDSRIRRLESRLRNKYIDR